MKRAATCCWLGWAIAASTTGAVRAADTARDWPQFRGPDGTNIVEKSAAPVHWTDAGQTRFNTPIPGKGWSSPVVADGRIWLTTAITRDLTAEELAQRMARGEIREIQTVAESVDLRAICIDLETGRLLHDLSLRKTDAPQPINPLNSYASPTCCIADGRVVCHFGSYGTWCLDAKTAEQLWEVRLAIDHGVGPGSSPVIYEGNVLLTCDGMDQQYVAAVDLKSGMIAWQTDRPAMRSNDGDTRKAFSTPLIIEINGAPQAVIPGAQWIVSYDPRTGEELWRADCGDGYSTTPMACYVAGLVVFSTGFNTPEFVAVDPTGRGDVTATHIRWRQPRGAPTMATPVASGERLYSISDRGVFTEYDGKTGEELSQLRVGGNFSASPLRIDHRVYLASREGTVTIVDLAEKPRLLATHDFEAQLMASPAVVGDDLLFRTDTGLIRISAVSQH
jgi:outer membrane protein assembly factor BamB